MIHHVKIKVNENNTVILANAGIYLFFRAEFKLDSRILSKYPLLCSDLRGTGKTESNGF